MPTAVSPDADLASAYDGMLATVREHIPSAQLPDFSDIHLGFAQLRDALGLQPTTRDLQVRRELASSRGLFIDELGPIWEPLPGVAQAINNVNRHASLTGSPNVGHIQRIFEGARHLGVSMRKSLGQHYTKIANDPRVQAFFATVRRHATQQISREVRELQQQLANVATDLADARQDVQRLQEQVDAALETKGSGKDHAGIDRRVRAAHLRSSTTLSTPKRHGAATRDQPQQAPAPRRGNTPRRTSTG